MKTLNVAALEGKTINCGVSLSTTEKNKCRNEMLEATKMVSVTHQVLKPLLYLSVRFDN
jgi:hypothetical protein